MPGHFFYSYKFPINGSKSNRKETKLDLVTGVVHDVVLDFPAGCQYLTHVRIMRGSFSIWPRNQAAYYAYEDFQLHIRDKWILTGGARTLLLDGWNQDDTEEHTIRVSLTVTEPEVYFAQMGLLEKMETFIRQQEAIIGVD